MRVSRYTRGITITKIVRDSRDIMVTWVISIIKNSRDIRGIAITRRIRHVRDIPIINDIKVGYQDY